MRRTAITTAVAVLALPASAVAATKAVVLSVDSHHDTIQLVDSSHVVHAYRYHGQLPKLHAGSAISFRQSGASIKHVRVVSGSSRSVSFLAKVVHSTGKHVVLRLADGRTVTFSSKQLHHKRGAKVVHAIRAAGDSSAGGNITVSIQGLTPGVTVMVTESVDSQGNVTITITLPPAGTPGVGGQQQANGVITDVQTDTFVLTTSDGSSLNLHMAAAQISNLNLQICDTASVTYHQDSNLLIADSVDDTGTSNSGDCSDQSGNPQDAIGAITAVAPDSITIDVPNQGSMTVGVDPTSGLTDGFVVGDVVDVTYEDNGDGTYSADDVEYVENDTTGTVSAVSDGSITLIDDNTGKPVTFTADPAEQMFDGVAVGDQVDVTFHVNNGTAVVDQVDDQSTDSGGDQGGD